MRYSRLIVLAMVVFLAELPLAGGDARAHFQELIPSTDILTDTTGKSVSLDMAFTHPMGNGPVMEMKRPVRFGVVVGGVETDLRALLRRTVAGNGRTTFQGTYGVKEPGDHVFFVEPAPYWEAAEGRMIVHYTKVVVDAFEGGGKWDALVGFPVEIQPLVRPYGLWTGNVFRGIVKRKGKPVPFATVEVAFRNDGSLKPHVGPFATQVVKADERGTFSYAIPRAGWWGFAALVDGEHKLPGPNGVDADVELGGLMWVRAVDMK